ncbi:MAG: GNAT family N-acetyltransferase [Bacteroidales bacterium]|nr:MAG: GNAT family N-acetyltransferase [Bacteroidales bacterium]
MKLIIANTKDEFFAGKELFLEYSIELNVDLSFQDFEKELREIDIQYNTPTGALILLKLEKDFIGCCGIRQFNDRVAELKRMYIRKEHRKKGYGRYLLDKAIEISREMEYDKIRLDTLESMQAAIGLYRSYGFREIEPYRLNPVTGARYFELNL